MHRLQRFVCIQIIVGALLMCGYSTQAQTVEPSADAPEFLYRDGENLILVNAETGEVEILPGIVAAGRDQFEWSPDGQFLVVKKENSANNYPYSPYCLTVYGMAEHKIIYDSYIACQIEDVEFSHDSATIAYSTRGEDGRHGILWLYNRIEGKAKQVYATASDAGLYGSGIDKIQWSLYDQYVTFEAYNEIMGGNTVGLNILNTNTLKIYGLSGGSGGYYASYNPIWSPDDEWFLLDLKEEYVQSGSRAFTDQQGDLYLIRSETGEKTRITFTPAEAETSPVWTADGQITYVIPQTITLTVNDALHLQAPETIIEPDDIEVSMETGCVNKLTSPDGAFIAAVCPALKGNDRAAKDLVIHMEGGDSYRAILQADQPTELILIGWR